MFCVKLPFNVITMRRLIAILACVTLIGLVGSAAVESEDGTNVNSRVKEEIYDEYDYQGDEAYDDDEADVAYDERQTDGETNIRLHIKNFQIQVPEASLDAFKKTDMATMIRNSILKLFGIPYEQSAESAAEPITDQQQPTPGDSMLQVNGNDLPAKFFLEISDFLMNNHDNDAVDDKRVESNHRKNAEIYATEEIKIERLENVNNVKNETITISKKRYSAGNPTNLTQLVESTSTENKFQNNVTHNHTESEDRFQQTKPIKLESPVMQVGNGHENGTKTKTTTTRLREKVIWRMDDDDVN